MKEWLDKEGNLVFEKGSKQISINTYRLKNLIEENIKSVFGQFKFLSVSGRVKPSDSRNLDGRAYYKKEGCKKEGWILLNLNKIVDPEDQNSITQKKIIDVLSHEVRHLLQPGYKNALLRFFYRKLYKTFLPLINPLIVMTTLTTIAQTILLITIIVGFNPPIYLIVSLLFFPILLIFFEICYWLDPRERDARKFAKKAIKDKRWLDIVQVNYNKEVK